MLASKPPFQSSTTDEIYRRAKARDYEWPDPSVSGKYISAEAKDLVSGMLEVAEERPDPDAIVTHPWFRVGYFPTPSEITVKLRDVAPDKSEFYMDELSEEMYDECYRNLKAIARDCMVGPWATAQMIHTQVWKEMAAEEKACLTPAIPLPEGIVYRPFEEWLKEQPEKLRARYTPRGYVLPRQLAEESSNSGTIKAPTGLLRQPPQSFAAQQRAQNRPVAPAPASQAGTAVSMTTALPAAPGRPEMESRQTVASEAVPTLKSRPRKEPRRIEATVRSRPADTVPKIDVDPIMSGALASSNALSSEKKPNMQVQVTEIPRAQPTQHQQSARSTSSSSTTSRNTQTASIFGPSDGADEVPGTRPDAVLDGLRRLQTELERALNARTMAIITSKTVAPPMPRVVVKWVDYINKFGLGYILNDGSVGCVLRNMATADGTHTALLPPAGMVVQNAERHIERRKDETYDDRHQLVPMDQYIHFYEHHGEKGLKHAACSPEPFRVSIGADGTPAKLKPGQDVFQHRKRERVIMWKKFANYMIQFGRDEGVPGDEATRSHGINGSTESPGQMVIFYERFGDVGCWVFRDGHLQVSHLNSYANPGQSAKFLTVQLSRSHQNCARFDRYLVSLLAPLHRGGHGARHLREG